MKEEINYKVSGDEWNKAMDEAFKKVSKKIKTPGFREGKVPRKIFEQQNGIQDIVYEAADKMIEKEYNRMLGDSKIKPIIQPEVKLVKADKDGLEVNFIIVSDPQVKLGEYKNLGVKKEPVEVTKEEIEHQIGHLVDNYAEIVIKEGKIENGDIAIIDFEGFKDGEPFERGRASNYSLEIGSHSFIPGFEEGLIGMSKGEEKDLELTFPSDYHAEDLKGAKVVFKVKVHEVKTREVPELDEDFFEDLAMDGVTNKEELEKQVEDEIRKQKEEASDDKYVEDLLEAASKNMEIDICDELITHEVGHMYRHMFDNLKYQGITEELYYKYSGKTKDEVKEEMRPEALKRLKNRYLLWEIIKQEGLKTTEEEINKRALELMDRYDMTEEELYQEIDKEMISMDLLTMKAIDILKGDKKD